MIYCANKICYVLLLKLKMSPLHWAVERNLPHIVKLLLENGARTNIRSKFDETAYEIAEKCSYDDILKMFLRHINSNPISQSSSSSSKSYDCPKDSKVSCVTSNTLANRSRFFNYKNNNLQIISFANAFFHFRIPKYQPIASCSTSKISNTNDGGLVRISFTEYMALVQRLKDLEKRVQILENHTYKQ